MTTGENIDIPQIDMPNLLSDNPTPFSGNATCRNTKVYIPVPAPTPTTTSRNSTGMYLNGVKYEWGKYTPPYRTFTMTFTETSSPSGFSPTYSDDATGLTAGSTEFDNFFGYSAVKLSTAGVETAEVKQNNGNLDITQLGTLTSGDNVMIKFPMLGVKMTKSGSTCTLSLTQKPNEPGYQYYAHTRGTTVKDQFYLGAYKSSGSTVMKSYSGQSPANNITIGNFRTYSQANGTGYDQIAIYQRMFVQALYMMKYGNSNSQSVIGRGYVDGNSGATTTGGTNSHTQASRGENTGKQQSKLFGLEDFRGNVFERVDGIWGDGSCYLWTNMNNTNFNDSGSGYTNTNIGGLVNGGGNITAISSTNNGMFLPISASGSDYEQYWCDYGVVFASRLAFAGGSWVDSSGAGAFRLLVYYPASSASATVGSRLMFL